MRVPALFLSSITLLFVCGCQTTSSVSPKPVGESVEMPSTTRVAFNVVDVDTGRALASKASNESAPLASATKLFTAAAALDILGPNHVFETSVKGKGRLEKGGVWVGDLALVGGGDPLLSVGHLMQLAQDVRNRGIKKVTGSIFFDASIYSTSSQIDAGMDAEASYNSGVSALSVDFNQIPVPRDRTATEKRKRLPVKDSGAHTATLWVTFARLTGIELKDAVPGRISDGERLAVHRSIVLSEIVDKMLEYSNNQVAELVSLATARKKMARPSLDSAGLFLRDWVALNVKVAKPRLSRGSGLTDKNSSTPAEMTDFLIWAGRAKQNKLLYRLSTAGWSGNLLDRLGNAELKFRVWGKTGSLDYVSNLSGYLFARSGKKLAFSVAVWDDSMRTATRSQTEDQRRDAATVWADDAARFQEALILNWFRLN